MRRCTALCARWWMHLLVLRATIALEIFVYLPFPVGSIPRIYCRASGRRGEPDVVSLAVILCVHPCCLNATTNPAAQ
jgi:hypothetical protein